MVSTRRRHRNGAASTAIEQHVQPGREPGSSSCHCHTEFSENFSIIKKDVDVYNTEYNTNLLMNCREASAKLSGVEMVKFCHLSSMVPLTGEPSMIVLCTVHTLACTPDDNPDRSRHRL